MYDAGRCRLLGTHHAPRLRVGAVLACKYRDCVVAVRPDSDDEIPF